jgi:hypothetical protein
LRNNQDTTTCVSYISIHSARIVAKNPELQNFSRQRFRILLGIAPVYAKEHQQSGINVSRNLVIYSDACP